MHKQSCSKVLTILLLTSLVIAAFPLQLASAQTMSIQISLGMGPVGTKVTVTGTIVSYNGAYEIWIDRNADGVINATDGPALATGTAGGYEVSKEVTIPDTYAGGRIIQLKDVSTAPVKTANAYFTVETAFTLKVDKAENYEGGPFTLTATVTGGEPNWNNVLDLRFRVKDPDGNEVAALKGTYVNVGESAAPNYGKFVQTYVIGDDATEAGNLVDWGTYTAILDWDTGASWPTAKQGVATKTFAVRLTHKSEYGRTATVKMKAYIPNGKTGDLYKVINPSGVAETVDVTNAAGPGFLAEGTWASAKDAPLGTYTVKVLGTDGKVIKSQTFTLSAATLAVTFDSATTGSVQRTTKATANFKVTYPSGAIVTSADMPAGLTVSVHYKTTKDKTTKVADITLDPLTAYNVGTGLWEVSWKIPKDAVKDKEYTFIVAASAITDAYGNSGPEKDASSGKQKGFFKVISATLTVTTPSLVYPGAGAKLERTREARASFKVTYPDKSTVTADDFKWVNATVSGGGKTYTVILSADDYSADVGLWIAKWKIPYNAPTAEDYTFKVAANQIVDAYGNKGPKDPTGSSGSFGVKKAVLSVTGLAVDKEVYETDEEVTISLEGVYPSGDKVTKGTATVKIYSGGTLIATKTASYDSVTKKFVAKWIVPSDATTGIYNAKIEVDALQDSVANTGPAVEQKVSFNVTRISLTSVISKISELDKKISDLEKTVTDLSGKVEALDVEAITQTIEDVKQDVSDLETALTTEISEAKTAAENAGDLAGEAKTAADNAATAASSAQSAASEAKTAALAAQSAASGISTAVYGAVILSLVAAIASILAVITLQRKVAG